MNMSNELKLYKEVSQQLLDKKTLQEISISKKDMTEIIADDNWRELSIKLISKADLHGRINSKDVLNLVMNRLDKFCEEPDEGWLLYAYKFTISKLFLEEKIIIEEKKHKKGRLFLLNILRAVYKYEEKTLAFDPTVNIDFLSEDEIDKNGYNVEYKEIHKLVRSEYIYEFMRIGSDITQYNTLGHIAGVHYVAMYISRQLKDLGVPIDLGIISGAAAGHDIGKYGCRKSEEKRTPYLHYYYTDSCYKKFNMPTIGHIAANHSTWDLELENLSAESLVLIYADFRVKGGRGEECAGEIHFYSLDDAFEIILEKLDDVDEAKKQRYQKVYNKLKDFENYIVAKGTEVLLPNELKGIENKIPVNLKKETVLLEANQVVEHLKHRAIEHNINLMSKFHVESEFGNLIEAARSERQWKNLRTYISIFGEYSTYMTEKQKLMTLRFLYELLAHKEGDIRRQAAEIIGQIIANFNDEYKKELPQGVYLKKKNINNLSLWQEYIDIIINPDHKLTEQHKKWISNSLKDVVRTVILSCKEATKESYIEALVEKYFKYDLEEDKKLVLLNAAIYINRSDCSEKIVNTILNFSEKIAVNGSLEIRIATIKLKKHFKNDMTRSEYVREIKKIMGIDSNKESFRENLATMFLDNLKASTPWIVKVANIELLLEYVKTGSFKNQNDSELLHVATHFANLVKVSETITVRKEAGKGLLSIISYMPLEQRNEIAVELTKGLEIGDYQFSKYIPDYLGIIMLHLPPKELEEMILDLRKALDNGNEKVVSSVLNTFGVVIENYQIYNKNFNEDFNVSEQRKFRLLNLMIKAFAGYNYVTSQEAIWSLGTHVFGSKKLNLEEKEMIFLHCHKKILTLLDEKTESELDFYNNSAVLNHLYRFICEFQLEKGNFIFPEKNKVAFFPGTFDPFSLSHKAIAIEIRNIGFEVYLALDEFSWSKNTQPRLQRRKIMSMTVADEENIYIFPEDIPINIANPVDLKKLKDTFAEKELFIAVGTDVINNASSYKLKPEENSIHSLNHIIFERESDENGQGNATDGEYIYPITGKIINLTLENYFEDISSTRIRENIDLNRDISNLIDAIAQNYIYDNNLYLREPAYKHILQAQEITLSDFRHRKENVLQDMKKELISGGYKYEEILEYLSNRKVKTVLIKDSTLDGKVVAVAAVHKIEASNLLEEFNEPYIASYIREKSAGGIAVIGGIYISKKSNINSLNQILITELLSELLRQDYAYVVYNSCEEGGINPKNIATLTNQGFINISKGNKKKPLYAVDMNNPIVIFKDVETVIKNPLNKNPEILKVIEEAHNRLLNVVTSIYPGQLVLSINTGIMHYKIIEKVTSINNVSILPNKDRKYGPYIAVPFGKVLEGVVVPNTVTKPLYTEKYFNNNVSNFTIEQSMFYSSLDDQISTVKSFNKPIILIDDLLHKGYRMNKLDPILKENKANVKEVIVGVLTGNGRDLMTVKQRSVDSAYFLPKLKLWIDERDSYPFIGGDSVEGEHEKTNQNIEMTSVNLILPYTVPTFICDASLDAMFKYSIICLENTKMILQVLEKEYQNTFERKLTLKRLGEVIRHPRRPDIGENISYDENIAPSEYVKKDIEMLIRLKRLDPVK